jgi:hypothetical protein
MATPPQGNDSAGIFPRDAVGVWRACPRPQESGGRGDGYGLPTVSALAPR